MITVEKDRVVLPRTSWDRLKNNRYYNELLENFIDSEELIEAIEKSKELIDLREYDSARRKAKIQN